MNLKRLSRNICAKLLDYSPASKDISRIHNEFVAVIYSVARIGDGIACSIAIDTITNQYKNHKIIVICSKYNKAVFEYNSNIELIIIEDEKNYFKIFSEAKKISSKYPIIDIFFEPSASNSISPLIFMRTLKAKKNITFRKSNLKMIDRLTRILSRFECEPVKQSHEIALRLSGINVKKSKFSFYLDRKAEEKIIAFIEEKGIKNYIAINLYGFDEKRKINNESAIKIIHALQSHYMMDIVLLCSPDTLKNVDKIASHFDNVYYFKKTENIHHSASLVKNASYLLSPDTSIVHIGSAFNIPTLAIFCDKKNSVMWPPHAHRSRSIICEDINEISPTDIIDFISEP